LRNSGKFHGPNFSVVRVYDDDDRLMAIFQDNPGYLVPECLHSGFYWS